MMLLTFAVNSQNYSESYKSLPKEFKGTIDRHSIGRMAEQLFHDFTGLNDELSVFCTNDARLTDTEYEWYCQISPKHAEVLEDGRVRPYPPDANSWTMNINLKNNTYDLKRTWIHE